VRVLRGAVLGVVLTLCPLAAWPAGAGTSTDPEVVDECGDAQRLAYVGDVGVESTESRPFGFDIAAAWFNDVVDSDGTVTGLQISLQLCGVVPPPELQGSSWTVTWDSTLFDAGERDCWTSADLRDVLDQGAPGSVVRVSQIVVGCSEPATGPLGQPASTGYTLSATELAPDVTSVDGGLITWELRPAELPPQIAELFVAGEVLASPSARTRDGRQVTMLSLDQPGIYVSPGAEDHASRGRDFVIGGS